MYTLDVLAYIIGYLILCLGSIAVFAFVASCLIEFIAKRYGMIAPFMKWYRRERWRATKKCEQCDSRPADETLGGLCDVCHDLNKGF